jgi:hypothetical protein
MAFSLAFWIVFFLSFSLCLLIQCRALSPLSGVQIGRDNIEVCQRAVDFEIKGKTCHFVSEGLRHNTEFLLKHSEIIFDYHSLTRYFSASFDIWLWELTISPFSLWCQILYSAWLNLSIYPSSARITWFFILECLLKSFSTSSFFSLKIWKSWYEPSKSEWIKIHSHRQFDIIYDFKQHDLCFPLKNSFLSSNFTDEMWILFTVTSTISLVSWYFDTLIRSLACISSVNLLVNTEWQGFITGLNTLFKVLRLAQNWIEMRFKIR